ncbi:phage protease [Leisingera sp. MMG026]|uniref:phage protease n=1 Tax=Leisingera sp. MMG026 TaxID=2909982 RepID=UPI001F271480|nr:phage protease [Leisingera sp. MMG026]MCF6432917.1 phage protease [Leisingera sp. MMG026]
MTQTNSIQTLALALNSEGATAPEWMQLTPAGPELEGRDGRKWKMQDPEAVVQAFREDGAELPVDFEHSTQEKGAKGEPAPAVGWVTDLEARNNALWAKVDWLDSGRDAVASRAYRYSSPVFNFSRSTGEVSRMVSVGLTNQPNFQLTALNREGEQEERKMDKDALEALGLKEGASDSDVLTAINKLKSDEAQARNRAESPDPAKFVPKADFDLAQNRIRTFEKADSTRQEEAITAAVDAAVEAGKIAPASRDYHTAACREKGGLERFSQLIDASPVIAGKSGLDAKDPAKTTTALSDDEMAACRALGMSEADFAEAKAKE